MFQMPPGHKIMSKMGHSRVGTELDIMSSSQGDAQVYVDMHCCPNINLTLICN